jgi:hypothetical protein
MRADWTVVAEGRSREVARHRSPVKHGDAMEKSFTIYEHGIDSYRAQRKMRGDKR